MKMKTIKESNYRGGNQSIEIDHKRHMYLCALKLTLTNCSEV